MSSLNDDNISTPATMSGEPTSQQSHNPSSILRRPSTPNPYQSNSQRNTGQSTVVLTPAEHEQVMTGQQQGSPLSPNQSRIAFSNVNGNNDTDRMQRVQEDVRPSQVTPPSNREGPISQGLGDVIRRDDGNYTTITPMAAALALREARESAAREYRRRQKYNQQRRELIRLRNESQSDLPELEEVNGSPGSNRRPESDPSFQLCGAEGMSDQARAIVKNALAESGSFSHIQLNRVNGSEFWDLLLSLVVHQVAAAAEVERTSEVLSRHGNILTSPLQELINVITREHRARPYFLKLQSASVVSLNPMNMAFFELQSLIGNKRVQALLGRTPPVEVIFQSIEMTIRRFFPDDHERIMVQMQNAQLSPKEHTKLVKNKGELAVWVLLKSRLQGVRQYSPQIFDLSSIQEQVDEEEYARIEEMLMGASITPPYHFDSESQAAEPSEDEVLQETEKETTGQREGEGEMDQIYEDLDPLDPMGLVLTRALRHSRRVVAAKSKLLNHYMLQSFETVDYVHELVPRDVSPAIEVGYPLDAIDFSYAGVQDNEAVKILMAKVVSPWVEKYYPDALRSLSYSSGKRTWMNLSNCVRLHPS
jgi:hypothetical protein